MKYLYSINKTIDLLRRTHFKNEPIKVRIGMRTNGDLHLGNLFPIVNAIVVGKKLVEEGYKFELIVVLVDQEINSNDLPFNILKYSKNKTLAAYSIGIIKKFISDIVPMDKNFVLEYVKVSETQKTKIFHDLLIKIMDKNRAYVYVVCKKCRKLLKKYRKKRNILKYHCNYCGKENVLNFDNLNKSCMLDHDLLGAIENNIFNMDLHILGSDHLLRKNGITNMEKREEYQKILNNDKNYLTLLTPLIIYKGSKMSKSKKRGIFLKEIKKSFGKDYTKKLVTFVENNSRKRITIAKADDLK